MRMRILTATLFGCVSILIYSFIMMSMDVQKINNIHMDTLSNQLYRENTNIMLQTMKAIDTSKLNRISLPESWGEIMLVDNHSLKIMSSTDPSHVGLHMYKITELLDQAGPILKAISHRKAGITKTKDYMVAIVPSGDAVSLVGLKPRTWERALLTTQDDSLKKVQGDARHIALITLIAGGIFSIIVSLITALLVARPITRLIYRLVSLSKGDFESPYPKPSTSEERLFAKSMERIRASLSIALNRLGVR